MNANLHEGLAALEVGLALLAQHVASHARQKRVHRVAASCRVATTATAKEAGTRGRYRSPCIRTTTGLPDAAHLLLRWLQQQAEETSKAGEAVRQRRPGCGAGVGPHPRAGAIILSRYLTCCGTKNWGCAG